MRISQAKLPAAEKALFATIKALRRTTPDEIYRLAESLWEQGIRDRDEDTLLELAEAATLGLPHVAFKGNWSSRHAGRRATRREINFQCCAALAAAGLHEMGFAKMVARDAVAQLAQKAGWKRKVTAEIVRDWERGKPNADSAICKQSGLLFVTVYKRDILQSGLPPICQLVVIIRDILRTCLLAPATSDDN